MLYNANRGQKQKALPLKDFVLKFGGEDEQPKKQTWQQQLAIMKMLAAAFADGRPRVPDVTEGLGLEPAPEQPPVVVEEPDDDAIRKYMAAHMAPSPAASDQAASDQAAEKPEAH